MGKIFNTADHHGIQEKFAGGFQTKFEIDIERVVHNYLLTDEFLSNFGELAKKYKIELTIFFFSTSRTQNLWCVAHSMYCRV